MLIDAAGIERGYIDNELELGTFNGILLILLTIYALWKQKVVVWIKKKKKRKKLFRVETRRRYVALWPWNIFVKE